MLEWFMNNLYTILTIAAVLGLVALSIYNLVPRKGKPSCCAGCSGCSGCCASCRKAAEERPLSGKAS